MRYLLDTNTCIHLLIAAHALHQGLVLVTNNTKEFKRVPGLRMENWIEAGPSRIAVAP